MDIGSADLMTGNTGRRVEIACPVWDEAVRKRLFHIIDVLKQDNVKSWQLKPGGLYHPKSPGDSPCCSQEIFQSESVPCPTPEGRRISGKKHLSLPRLSRLFRR